MSGVSGSTPAAHPPQGEGAGGGAWSEEEPLADKVLWTVLFGGLVAGGAMALPLGAPSDLPDKLDGPVGALAVTVLAVWAALDKWQSELSGRGSRALQVATRLVGLTTPMVAVGAAMTLSARSLSSAVSVLVAVSVLGGCLLLVFVLGYGLVGRPRAE